MLKESEVISKLYQSRSTLLGDHVIPLVHWLNMVGNPASFLRVTTKDFRPTIEQLNSTNPPFNYFASANRKQFAVPGIITPDAAAFCDTLYKNTMARFGRSGRSGNQHSCITVVLGIALHPACKGLVFSKGDLPGVPTLFDAETKASAVRVLRTWANGVILDEEMGGEKAAAAGGGESEPAAKRLRSQFSLPGLTGEAPVTAIEDEVSAWMAAPALTVSAAEFWALEWKNTTSCYPKLRVVARAIYGIPLTSADDERNFSHANKVLAKDRLRMKPETFKELMLLRLNPSVWSSNRDLVGMNKTFDSFWM